MKRCSWIMLLLLLSAPAGAQDTPKWEAMAGYSYLRLNFDFNSFSLGTNQHGWNVSLARNLNRKLALVGDASGHYGSFFSAHTYTLGLRFNYRRDPWVTPFAHVLLGGSTYTNGGGSTAFALLAGGGVDVKVHERTAIRLMQAEYLLNRFSAASLHNARLSFGVVFRLGKK